MKKNGKKLSPEQAYVELHSKVCYQHDPPVRCVPFGKKNKLHWRRYICLECGLCYWYDGDDRLLNPFETDEYNKLFQRHQLKLENAFEHGPRTVVPMDGWKRKKEQ